MLHWTFLPSMRLACLTLVAIAGSLSSTPGEAAEGAWKEKTQVVWSKQAGALIRKSFRVWDPHPELDLDFLWEPRLGSPPNSPDNIVNGPGTLTWRDRGAASYDRRLTHSIFKGMLKNGRPHGQGALMIRSGLYYAGEWIDGEMHGRGNLRLASGDRYEGDFAAGKMHGVGKYTSTDGTVYFGEFRNGVRDGIGRLTLIDGAYRTVWRDGREIERQLIADAAPARPAAALRLAAISNTVRLKLSLDHKKAIEFENADPDAESHAYEAEHSPGSMRIYLGSKMILDAWKGDGMLASSDDGIMNAAQFAPVFLKVELENAGTAAAQVRGAFLDVLESTTDLMPYLELHPRDPDWNEGHYLTFEFNNFGWGRVRDARVTYSLGTDEKRSDDAVISLGSFEIRKTGSVANRLRQLGVDIERLRRARGQSSRGPDQPASEFECDAHKDTEEETEAQLEKCYEHVKNSGVFGRFKDFVFRHKNDGIIYTAMAGRIEYRWTAGDGKTSTRTSPFKIGLPLLRFNPEEGEQGAPEAIERPFKSSALSLDRRKYRIALPKTWDERIPANQTKELGFILSAPKSSHHVFQLVVQLADGNEAKSPMVDLSYFRPRVPKSQ